VVGLTGAAIMAYKSNGTSFSLVPYFLFRTKKQPQEIRNEFYHYICNKLSTGSIIKRTRQEATDKPERQSIAQRNNDLHTAISDGKHSTTEYSPAGFSTNLTKKGGVKRKKKKEKETSYPKSKATIHTVSPSCSTPTNNEKNYCNHRPYPCGSTERLR